LFLGAYMKHHGKDGKKEKDGKKDGKGKKLFGKK
jgi:hypothetical protein